MVTFGRIYATRGKEAGLLMISVHMAKWATDRLKRECSSSQAIVSLKRAQNARKLRARQAQKDAKGGNITTENVNVRHFLNLTWVSRPVAPHPVTAEEIFGAHCVKYGNG
jgi:hypothetical protein